MIAARQLLHEILKISLCLAIEERAKRCARPLRNNARRGDANLNDLKNLWLIDRAADALRHDFSGVLIKGARLRKRFDSLLHLWIGFE